MGGGCCLLRLVVVPNSIMVDAVDSASVQHSSAISIPQRKHLLEEERDELQAISASPNINNVSHDAIKSQERAGNPLNSPWTFWFDRYQRGCTAAEYEANLKKLYTVSTIEGFWGVYNNIPDVGRIGLASYHLMRDERRPIWEDDCNVRGGYWKMRCNKDKTPTLWKELLLAVIGEQLSNFVHDDDEIVGVSVSVRDRDDIIQVWNQEAKCNDSARIIEAIHDLDQDLTLSKSFYKVDFRMMSQLFPAYLPSVLLSIRRAKAHAHIEHTAFESGSKRNAPQAAPSRRFEPFSNPPPGFGTPPGYGASPRQAYGTPPRDFVPHRFGTPPRQSFGPAQRDQHGFR